MVEVYTPEFVHLRTIAHPRSVKWNLHYNGIGSCEMYLSPHDDAIKIFMTHNDLIIVQGRLSAWVNGCADDMGGFLVSGRTLNCLLENRQVLPFERTDTREGIIRDLIAEQFMTAGDKKIDGFILGDVIGNTAQDDYILDEYSRPLYDIAKEICDREKLGFDVYFDYFNGNYVFNLLRGVNHSAAQNENLPLILSEVNRNITQTQYLKNNNNYKTAGYLREVDEQGEAVFTEIIKDNVTGFYRREMGLTAEDEIELTNARRVVEIDGTIYGLRFGADFGLGDIVTLQKQIGGEKIAQDRRIVEITINSEVGNDSIITILGET